MNLNESRLISQNDTRQRDSSASVTFIDVLFAVVISLGFSKIMTRPWFNQTSYVIEPAFAFEIITLLLGYSTLLLSWWGYHRSIERRYIQENTWAGKLSFAVDILILVCYWLLLVKFESFFAVLLVWVLVYWMYVIWDHLRWRRQGESEASQWRRRGVTTLWTTIITAIFIIYLVLGLNDASLTAGDWIFVVLCHLANLFYRLNKSFLFPKPILDLLAYRPRYQESH